MTFFEFNKALIWFRISIRIPATELMSKHVKYEIKHLNKHKKKDKLEKNSFVKQSATFAASLTLEILN